MAAWAGLGYYARARDLLACARMVTREYGGRFPQSEAELLKLPGIGAYTAAAIAAIAFGQRAVVIDANIERVVARLFAITVPLPMRLAEHTSELQSLMRISYAVFCLTTKHSMDTQTCESRSSNSRR